MKRASRIAAAVTDLQEALLAQAEANIQTYSPGFTHLQVAQPVTFGHHMLAYVEMLRSWDDGEELDVIRLYLD